MPYAALVHKACTGSIYEMCTPQLARPSAANSSAARTLEHSLSSLRCRLITCTTHTQGRMLHVVRKQIRCN